MRKVNLYQQITSQNFQRAKRIRTGVKIISSISRSAKIVNPVGLYIEAATSLTDAIYEYIILQQNKQITENLKNEVEIVKEKIKQFNEFIEEQKLELVSINKTFEVEIDLISNKLIKQNKLIEFNKLIFEETGKILKVIKEVLEKEKNENPESKKLSNIEKEYRKAISSRTIALINLISEDNIYEINF